jgi:microcystin-dependent protein
MVLDQYLGEIRVFTGDFAPQGWLVCDGALLSIDQNRQLFNLLGTTYGGDGQRSFAIPDIQGRITMGWGQGEGLSPRQIGGKGGVTEVRLSHNEMPVHTHLPGGASPSDVESPAGAVWGNPGTQRPIPNFFASALGSNPVTMNAGAISTDGNNDIHTNMMPFQSLLFCIAVEGPFSAQE